MALKTQLASWGFTKHLKRGEVLDILRAKATRDAAGKDSAFTLRGRPVSLEQVEKHRRKFGIPSVRPGNVSHSRPVLAHSSTQDLVCRTPPPSPYASIPVIEIHRVPEKLLYDIDVLAKGSFEAGRWKFVSNEQVMYSSEYEVQEKQTLHDFIGNIINGSAAAKKKNYNLAFEHWQQACVKVDGLVNGQYHDIIPNLIQQINDLNRQDLAPVAASLKAHIAESSSVHGKPGEPTAAILAGLGQLDMSLMVVTEERIMTHFHLVFEQYLGYRCYNSFVMMIDGARRRLLHDKWATFADCLPDVAELDSMFYPKDRRALDVIGLRLEILKNRDMPVEAEEEASDLVRRAEGICNDDWQRFYHLTRAWYFLGWAQYSMLGKQDQATSSFHEALRCNDELCKIEDFHIFVSEQAEMQTYLDELKHLNIGVASKE